jgi:hydrogenase expression/formation protein HypC
MRLVEIHGHSGKAEVQGVAREVRLDFVPQARLGDFVLLHAGYAIQLMDETEAGQTLALIEEVLRGTR